MKILPLSALALAAGMMTAGCAPALVSSSRKGDLPAVQRLIARGADVNAKDNSTMGMTPLHEAARYGHPEIVQLLLEKGADPNRVNGVFRDFNQTPLHYAAFRGCDDKTKEIVRLLLAAGADPEIRDHNGETPADKWLREPKDCGREVARMLKDAPKDRAAAKERKARAEAAKAKDAEIAAVLKAALPDIESAEKAGDEAVAAAQHGKALERYASALAKCPPGAAPEQSLREKVIRAAQAMTPAPPIPEEARHMAQRAKSFLKYAEDAAGYAKSAEELEGALRLAPWWAEAYFNLGLVRERLGAPADAIRSLKLYLLAAPGALDAETVRAKIVDLEVRQELPSLRAPQR